MEGQSGKKIEISHDEVKRAPVGTDEREYSQALIRLAIHATLLCGALLALWRLEMVTSVAIVTTTIALIILVPVGLLISVTRNPVKSTGRIYTGLLFDIASVSVLLFLGSSILYPLCIAYTWIVFDFTRRYGAQLLYPSALGSILSFAALLLVTDFWRMNFGLGLVFLGILALMPLYLRNSMRDIRTPPAVTVVEANNESPPDSEPLDDTSAVDSASKNQADSLNLVGKKILLISADNDDRHGIFNQLKIWGAQAIHSRNAACSFYELISAMKQGNPFSIVIVDHGRLGMDPAQFASAVRSEPELQSTYLIHVGPNDQGQLRDRLLNAGFTKLLSTPLNKTFLFNALHNSYTQPVQGGQVVRLIDRYTSESNVQPLSVLVADRSFNIRQRIRSILQQAGHQVFMVNNGARVLDALDSHGFDVAIVSQDLREITGLEAFKLYRFTRVDKQIVPFVLLLEDPTTEMLKRCTDAGISATIEQNANPRKYLETVAKVVLDANKQTGTLSLGQASNSRAGMTRERGGLLDNNRLIEIERLGGGLRFLADLIDSFNRDNRHILTQMQEAVASVNPVQFRDLGHAIKDAAGSLGAVKLYQLGTAASRLSNKEFHESAATLVQEITECCRVSNNELHTYLLGQSSPESDSLRE